MRTKTRALSVEPVEDRSLPSTTFVFVEPAFSYRPHGGSNGLSKFSEVRGWQARTFQAETFIRVRFSDDSILFIRETPTGFRLIPINGGNTYTPPANTPTPPPFQGPIADGATSSSGGSGQGNDSGSSPVASRGPVRSQAVGTAIGEVALAPSTEATPATQPVNVTQNTAAVAAAQQVTTPTNPAAVTQATPALNGRSAYAITAIVPDAADGAGAVPPASAVPTPAPTPAPATIGGSATDLIQVAAAVAMPVAGLVPLDLSALQSGASQLLDRVADLAPDWPDAMPGFTDTLWVAVGVLLTGGVIHAARNRPTPRPARDPLASALSEWERRNGRAAG